MNGTLDRLYQALNSFTRIMISPASNMRVAILLYATLGILLLIILVIGLLFIFAAPPAKGPRAPKAKKTKASGRAARTPRPMSPRVRVLFGLATVVVVLVVWVAAGYTTSDPALCKSCHWPTSEHAKAKGKDPHADTDCVACHEPRGAVGRYSVDVPLRMIHLASASAGIGDDSEYGQVTTRACTSCHEDALPGITTNAERGLKMSHEEPLAAAASCLDCHTMRGGIVSVHNAGMRPCLRCHDDNKTSSACTTCHTGQVAEATRARTMSFQNEQIKEVSCSGCHNEKKNCDPCHGIRMPHSAEFMGHAHARAGAVDLWYNRGKACGRCHTASSRPCTRCHTSLLGSAHGGTSSMANTHQKAAPKACDSCHSQYAYVTTRDFCKDVCHSKAAIAASPR
jgi:hypothetical protein